MRSTREMEFEELYRALLMDVRRFVAAHVGQDEVEEVVNATFASAWQRFDDMPTEARRAWIVGVARNHCRNRWRSDRRSHALVNAVAAARPRTEVALFEHRIPIEVRSALESAVAGLSFRDRELLVLTGWLEMSPAEISLVIGASAATVRVRLHRLRTRLDAELSFEDGAT